MTVWAIVPVKSLQQGKSRLSGVLAEDQRALLNRYLLERVLATLKEIPEIEHTLVISRDPAALALTRARGGRTVVEAGPPKFNATLRHATMVARTQGADAVLILPVDLPLIEPADIKALLKRGKNPPVVVISPDRRQDGTNGLFVNPAGLIEYGYGPGSFHRHSKRAIEAGARLVIIETPNIVLDLDLPEDMEAWGGMEKFCLV